MRTFLFALIVIVLAGCATPHVATPVDQQYVDAVDRDALRRGHTVIWLHYPTLPASKAAKAAPQS